jgi:hypothetical protein
VNQQGAVPSTVHFDIGRITLHGYSPAQRSRFVTSLRAHLADLSAQGGYDWPAGGRRVGHLDAGLLRPGAPPEEAARRVATRLLAAAANGSGRGRRERGGAS